MPRLNSSNEKGKSQKSLLMAYYWAMEDHFGFQDWWPGETPDEVAIGAILTQNTNWSNVEKAIRNLKAAGALSISKLASLARKELASLIRSSGYFNIKERRLRAFSEEIMQNFNGSILKMSSIPFNALRERLLAVNGIGEETADSIILYAIEAPTFVVDTYTRRVASRHGLVPKNATYAEIKYFYESNLEKDVDLFKEYHALLVAVGKHFCKPKPQCEHCPLSCYL